MVLSILQKPFPPFALDPIELSMPLLSKLIHDILHGGGAIKVEHFAHVILVGKVLLVILNLKMRKTLNI